VSALFGGVDWEVVATFAALVLVEGLRRIPAGGLVVRALGRNGWTPAGQPEPRDRWALVSWWSPLAPALVLPPLGDAAPVSAERLAARMQAARRAAPWLAAGGALTLWTLVLGLPLATARLGGFGFLVGCAVVLTLSFTTAPAGWRALRRLEDGRATRRARVLGWCSPFASGRVLEGVYQAALAGASPAQALRALAGDQVFGEWARARAYDAVRRAQPDRDLSAAADPAVLEAIVAAEPPLAASGSSYCPRCAVVWTAIRESCPDCDVPAMKPGPRRDGGRAGLL
jgi:hypothetical protein